MIGLVICKTSAFCDCGNGEVVKGRMYTVEEVHEDYMISFSGQAVPISCGREGCLGLLLGLVGNDHLYCSTLFSPLGDPNEEILETDEPKVNAPIKLDNLTAKVRWIND